MYQVSGAPASPGIPREAEGDRRTAACAAVLAPGSVAARTASAGAKEAVSQGQASPTDLLVDDYGTEYDQADMFPLSRPSEKIMHDSESNDMV